MEEDDLEEELLAVAGRGRGGASGGLSSSSRKRSRASRRSSSSDGSSSALDDEDEDALGGVDDEEEEMEEGESSRRLTAAAAYRRRGATPVDDDGRDDDEEDEDEDEDGGYGSDLYGDEEDRRRLAALTEFEREMILTERAESRDRAAQKRQLLQQSRAAQEKEERKTEVRASSRRAKQHTGADSALRTLVAVRAKKQKAAQETKRRRAKRASDEDEASSDDDDDWEQDDDADENFSVEHEGHEPYSGYRDDQDYFETRRQYVEDDLDEASYEECRSIQTTRTKLEEWVNEPFFEVAIIGAMLRVAQGMRPDPNTGARVPHYLMMQVVEVVEKSKSYSFGGRSRKAEDGSVGRTHKHLLVREGVGGSEVSVEMSIVSNGPLTEEEWERWERQCRAHHRGSLTKGEVQEVQARLREAETHTYTHDEVRQILQSKRDRGLLPKSRVLEKARLLRERDHARQQNDEELLARVEQELKALEVPTTERVDEKGSEAGDVARQGRSMAGINMRNKERNLAMALRGVSNRPEGERERQGADPFSRRATRPNIYWNTKGSKEPEEGKKDGKSKLTISSKEQPKKLEADLLKLDPLDLIRKLDINVDLSRIGDASAKPSLSQRLLGRHWLQGLSEHSNLDLSGRTILSVADWKRKAGFL